MQRESKRYDAWSATGELLVWIRDPSVATGLERVLRREFEIHRGLEPPDGEPPSLVVLSVEDAEALPGSMERAREPNPDALIVVFGPRLDPFLVRAALQAGARGYIHAGNTPDQVVRILEVVANGAFAVPRQLLEHLVHEIAGKRTGAIAALSGRQREVLKLAADGLSNTQIGERLFLSESTVKQHLRSAYKLLGVKNRTKAAGLFHRLYS